MSNLRGVLIIPSCNVDTSVSNKSEKWAEAFVLGWGLRLRWAEVCLRLRRAKAPERTPVGQDPSTEVPGKSLLDEGLGRVLLSGSKRKGRRPSALAEAPVSGFGSGLPEEESEDQVPTHKN